jgi:hypothetical protein
MAQMPLDNEQVVSESASSKRVETPIAEGG